MKRILMIVLPAVGVVVLAACGSNTSTANTHAGSMMSTHMSASRASNGASPRMKTSAMATGPHNTADVAFLTDMIPHHAQAVTMAQMAGSHATTPGVRNLAVKIRAAQTPEIKEMSRWLTGWKAPVPSSSYSMGGMGGMGHRSMPGMMSDTDMTSLSHASGKAFDRMWLTQMITHHHGAITMAKTELTGGQNAQVKSLAQSIITSQTAEIVTMERMLAELPS